MKLISFLAALCSGVMSVCSHAEMATDELFDLSLEELRNVTLVSAASGFEQSIKSAPASVYVIHREQWQEAGARLLADVLPMIPGMHVDQPFVQGKDRFTLRGLGGSFSQQIKILFDGEAISYVQSSGVFNAFDYPLHAIARIEVVRGPGSSVYGADAFAGTINLIPITHSQSQQAGARVGNFSTQDAFANTSFSYKELDFTLSAEYVHSNGDSGRIVDSDLQSTFDSIFGSSASNAPAGMQERYKVTSIYSQIKWQDITFDYQGYRNNNAGTGAGIAQAIDPEGIYDVHFDNYRLRYSLDDVLGGQATLTFAHHYQDVFSYLHVFPANTILPIGADGNLDFVSPVGIVKFTDGYIGTPTSEATRTSAHLTQIVDISEHHKIRWQVGYEHQDYNSTERKNFGPGVINGTEGEVGGQLTDVSDTPLIFLPDVSRHLYYISLQDEWKVSPTVQLNIGARYDHYSDFGSTSNPRVSLIWQARPDITVKIFGGSAFRAPSITDL